VEQAAVREQVAHQELTERQAALEQAEVLGPQVAQVAPGRAALPEQMAARAPLDHQEPLEQVVLLGPQAVPEPREALGLTEHPAAPDHQALQGRVAPMVRMEQAVRLEVLVLREALARRGQAEHREVVGRPVAQEQTELLVPLEAAPLTINTGRYCQEKQYTFLKDNSI